MVWERLYNGTDMRLDSLALGALLALTFDTARVQRACTFLARPWLVWLMVAIMVAGALSADVRTLQWYAWQQPLFVLLSLALIMSILKTPTAWGLEFFFQNPVSLYLGAICYGLYLWHYPLIWIGYSVFDLGVWQCLAICGSGCAGAGQPVLFPASSCRRSTACAERRSSGASGAKEALRLAPEMPGRRILADQAIEVGRQRATRASRSAARPAGGSAGSAGRVHAMPVT